MNRPEDLGAVPLGDGRTLFRVWAPDAARVELKLAGRAMIAMDPREPGYHEATVSEISHGQRYSFSIDGGPERPDPGSRFQPDGVHGPSSVVHDDFAWTDAAWQGLPLERHVIYELHVGTYTPQGTFEAIIPRLIELKDLGITAIELMPIAQFPGSRNWGYDGVCPYAAQNSYGGPNGLKRLVDACHGLGLAVVLDVVYNHLGPEGNYLGQYGPYFTDRYKTPWGPALNFDGPGSDEVRRYFIGNALYWVTECRVDALRLDAVHAIVDPSPVPFIQELCAAVHGRARELGRQIHLIAESAANDARLTMPAAEGGIGADAQWNDDFHHALRTVITGDRAGYYSSYGSLAQLAKAYREGFVYTGERSEFHQRRQGNPSRGIPAERLVVFDQNHDHIGNRMLGERIGALVSFEQLKLAAGAVILSPYIPLLFMGEEYAETAPFLYFVSHGDPALIEAVRKGRAEEFKSFAWQGEAPDPQSDETFQRSKLHHELKRSGRHAAMLAYYRELLRFRREIPALADLSKDRLEASADEQRRLLVVRRWSGPSEAVIAMNFGDAAAALETPSADDSRSDQAWTIAIDSSDRRWCGPREEAPQAALSINIQPHSVMLLTRGDPPRAAGSKES